MQMYRVKFANQLAGDYVDLGDVLVCAQSQDAARQAVVTILDLPASGVEMDVRRVKPSLYQVSRRTVQKSITAFDALPVDAAAACVATFPGVTENMKDEFWFTVEASADVKGEDEDDAASKLSDAIRRAASGKAPRRSVRDFSVRCDRKEMRPRSPAVGRNAIYTEPRIFAGGAARGN